MEMQNPSPKKYGILSWLSLIIGVTSFFLVFVTPTRVANTGSAIGDSITLSLMVIGSLISIVGLLKKNGEKGSLRHRFATFPFIHLLLDHEYRPFGHRSDSFCTLSITVSDLPSRPLFRQPARSYNGQKGFEDRTHCHCIP